MRRAGQAGKSRKQIRYPCVPIAPDQKMTELALSLSEVPSSALKPLRGRKQPFGRW